MIDRPIQSQLWSEKKVAWWLCGFFRIHQKVWVEKFKRGLVSVSTQAKQAILPICSSNVYVYTQTRIYSSSVIEWLDTSWNFSIWQHLANKRKMTTSQAWYASPFTTQSLCFNIDDPAAPITAIESYKADN